MQTPIDFKTVESVPYRKTITIVNNFIINTTQFLNKFSYLCEKKLADVSDQIQNLEITMNILEAKLASIPGLEGSVPPSTDSTTTNSPSVPAPPTAPPAPPLPGSASNIPAPPPLQQQQQQQQPSTPAESSDDVGLKVKDDPRFAPFFKMLRLGVLPVQIKMQMQNKGLDPAYLDQPDAPAPPPSGPSLTSSANRNEEDEDDDIDSDEEPKVALPPPPMKPQDDANDDEDDDDEEEDEY